MDTSSQRGGPVQSRSPRRVQVWFLSRSRRLWKQKFQELRREAKRLRNRVAAVTESRQEWRAEVEHLRQQLRQRDEELATLKAPPGQAGAGGKSAAGGAGLVG